MIILYTNLYLKKHHLILTIEKSIHIVKILVFKYHLYQYIPLGSDYDTAVKELKIRENNKNVVIKVSNILETYKDKQLMLNHNHPTTFMFLKLLEEICIYLKIDFFLNTDKYLITDNYTHLNR